MKQKRRMTIEELKKCEGFENYTDEQAEETIKTLETLARLFYELYIEHKQRKQKLKIVIDNRDYESEQRIAA